MTTEALMDSASSDVGLGAGEVTTLPFPLTFGDMLKLSMCEILFVINLYISS